MGREGDDVSLPAFFVMPLQRLLAALLPLLCLPWLPASAAPAPRRPNVILLLADDQGTIDLHCYGARDLSTPHLDDLARRGVRFTQAYVANPVCSPSRAALLTGRYPQRAGLTGNAPSQPGHPGMPGEQLTLAELFKGAGYRTALFGKWHLGSDEATGPNAQGFDEFFGHLSGCIDNYSHFFYWQGPPVHDLYRNRTEVWESGTHFSDLVVREAKRFLGENRDRPFFLYLPFNVPHYPLQARSRFRQQYAALPEPRRSYAAWVTDFDHSVGEIMARVDELGLRENTVVLFLSDHGHSTEERADFGGGNAGIYRGSKFSLLEGGIRIPTIISYPGHLPAGEVREQMVVSPDWFPTLAELAGVPLPARKLDGASEVAVLRSAAAPSAHREWHWQLGNQWAVRDGTWKLVRNALDTDGKPVPAAEQTLLSNLSEDATERHNLAREHPDVVQRLTGLHEQWAAEVTSQGR